MAFQIPNPMMTGQPSVQRFQTQQMNSMPAAQPPNPMMGAAAGQQQQSNPLGSVNPMMIQQLMKTMGKSPQLDPGMSAPVSAAAANGVGGQLGGVLDQLQGSAVQGGVQNAAGNLVGATGASSGMWPTWLLSMFGA